MAYTVFICPVFDDNNKILEYLKDDCGRVLHNTPFHLLRQIKDNKIPISNVILQKIEYKHSRIYTMDEMIKMLDELDTTSDTGYAADEIADILVRRKIPKIFFDSIFDRVKTKCS